MVQNIFLLERLILLVIQLTIFFDIFVLSEKYEIQYISHQFTFSSELCFCYYQRPVNEPYEIMAIGHDSKKMHFCLIYNIHPFMHFMKRIYSHGFIYSRNVM